MRLSEIYSAHIGTGTGTGDGGAGAAVSASQVPATPSARTMVRTTAAAAATPYENESAATSMDGYFQNSPTRERKNRLPNRGVPHDIASRLMRQ